MGQKSEKNDIYQERYLAHQERKKKVLIEIMKKRYSHRIFSDKPVEEEKIKELLNSVKLCPSSCDRRAISINVVVEKDKKQLLGGILVGGIGWIHLAPVILLIMADPQAYKAKEEIKFMPYLDAGVVIQQLYLMGTALGLKTAYVNPNIRKMNISHFKKIFGRKIFCGAFAVGYSL